MASTQGLDMDKITDTEISRRLAFDNPWWAEGAGIDREYRAWPRRAYFKGFYDLVERRSPRRAVVLMGPRRVGKTVMINQAIQSLLDAGVAGTAILYVSLDTPVYTGLWMERLVTLFLDRREQGPDAELFVFFDEVQYHPDWERHLKSLVDSYRGVKFTVSGSAAAALRLKSQESGAGRFTDYHLPPLSFSEFLTFRGHGEWVDWKIEALNAEFIDYINFGGFPEAVMDEAARSDMSRYIANDIVDKVLLRDLPSLYGIADVQELKRLLTMLAYNTGNEITYENLGKESGIAKNTLRKYIEYLEAAFLISRLHRIDHNAARFKRETHFKVYLTNPSLHTALFGPVADTEDARLGRLVETAIVSQIAQGPSFADWHYARWDKGEVDLVSLSPVTQKPVTAVEIKWSDRIAHPPFDGIRHIESFCDKNGLAHAYILTKTASLSVERPHVTLTFTQASLYAGIIGGIGISDTVEGRLAAALTEAGPA
jgi:predicted AAA+ superfamily ATPase